jgi:hypothetical protein
MKRQCLIASSDELLLTTIDLIVYVIRLAARQYPLQYGRLLLCGCTAYKQREGLSGKTNNPFPNRL